MGVVFLIDDVVLRRFGGLPGGSGRNAFVCIQLRGAGYDGRTVLHDVNLNVYERDFLGIIGPNGGGKTTLIKCILGLLKPTAGEIAKNAARNRPKAQSTIQNPQKSASGKTVSERDSLSGYQSGFSRQPEPGIRKTGAVKPRVTSITDLEDDRDQNLQEWEGSVSENGGNTDDGKRRKGIFRMLIAAGIIVVLIGGIIAVRTIRKPSDNGEPSYTDSDDSDALNKGNFGTADDADKSFAQAMETIRDHATTIENALDSYRREGTEGDRLRFYNGSGEIAKVLVYPGSSADGVYEEYFYWGEQMFYTYVWDGDEKQYFYYQDGLLIRWIDADGKVHDKESDNDEYVELGDKYWSNSVMELQQ